MRACNEHILATLELAEEMLSLADRGDMDREDTGCGILFGVMRDAGYRLKQLAEKEKDAHIRKGWWTNPAA